MKSTNDNHKQPTSFKDRLNGDVINADDLSDNTHHINRETGSSTTVLFISKTEKRSFAYSYLQNVGMDDKSGDIDLNFASGTVVIKGKNLDKLFLDLHRHKVSDVTITTIDIDDIIVTLNRD